MHFCCPYPELHAKRIFGKMHCQILNLESPVENGGREYINQILIQKLMTKDPAPSQIIELVVSL